LSDNCRLPAYFQQIAKSHPLSISPVITRTQYYQNHWRLRNKKSQFSQLSRLLCRSSVFRQRAVERENYDTFAGDRADIRMQTDDLLAGYAEYGRFQKRPSLLDEFSPDLFYKSSSSGVFCGAGELLFGWCQHPSQADNYKVVDDMGTGFFGASSHIFLFEFYQGFAYFRFDLTFAFSHKIADVRVILLM
jgi:hypothetical protein